MEKIPAFCSWSGGKDSCLALYHALKQGYDVKLLLSMLAEDGKRSRSHGLRPRLLEMQARALGIPIEFSAATWARYEEVFIAKLEQLADKGIKVGVFGDIDIKEHREWVEGVCAKAGMRAILPLWNRDRSELLAEFMGLGFCAVIVAAKNDALDESWLGRPLTLEMIKDFQHAGIDASGERGEYHTFACDGAIFKHRVVFETGSITKHDEYSFLELVP